MCVCVCVGDSMVMCAWDVNTVNDITPAAVQFNRISVVPAVTRSGVTPPFPGGGG